MKTRHFLLAAALVLGGLSCAGLPVPKPPMTKLVVVDFHPGTATISTFNTASWYLEHSLSSTPVFLRSGLNYIAVDAARPTIRIERYYATSDIREKRYTLATRALSRGIALPNDGTVVLVGVTLSYHEVKMGNGYRLEADVTPMEPAKARAILEGWKKDKNAAFWPEIRLEDE